MTKTCSRCRVEKARSDFHKRTSRPDGLRSDCKACNIAVAKAWQRENQASHAKNQSSWYRENKASAKASVTAWRERNPDRRTESDAKRRATKRMACPTWANRAEIRRIYKRARTMSLETGIPHQVDHIVPLCSPKVSGLHVHWNLQVLPATENRAKSNRHD